MGKDETAKYLSGLGYAAEHEGGKIAIYVNRPMGRGSKDRVRNALRAIGYKGTWGWRMR